MSPAERSPGTETAKQRTGRMGEDAAAKHYEAQGFSVVARNVHMSHNEIDLIVADDTYLVFVEVKTRHGAYGARSRYGRPADAVDRGKKTRTVEAAQAYLREHPTPLQPRIDVVEVYVTRYLGSNSRETDEVTRVVQFRNAFGAR